MRRPRPSKPRRVTSVVGAVTESTRCVVEYVYAVGRCNASVARETRPLGPYANVEVRVPCVTEASYPPSGAYVMVTGASSGDSRRRGRSFSSTTTRDTRPAGVRDVQVREAESHVVSKARPFTVTTTDSIERFRSPWLMSL